MRMFCQFAAILVEQNRMSDPLEQGQPLSKRQDLRDAIRRVRIVQTEQADGLADLRDAERARLELLADSLTDLFAEVPDDLDFFAFALSNGDTLRLWIDMTCHVALGRDRRTYRLLKDTRLGRTVLHETADRDEMTAHVTDYVAERVLDRQRAIEGDWMELRARASHQTGPEVAETQAAPALMKQPEPSDAANEDTRGARPVRTKRPSAETETQPRAGGAKWIAFFVGLLLGAAGLAAWMMANGRL